MTEPIDILPAPVPAPGSCGCGGHDEADPVLDVRTIPHAIRHGVVFGAFDALAPGASLVLVAPHEPRPLLAQLAARAPLAIETLVPDPAEWHVRITKGAAE